jgi:hypothetical protein
MTAKGKVNASNVQAGDRIIVDTRGGAYEGDTVRPSQTKTGDHTVIVRVQDKLKAAGRRGYVIVTSVGQFYAEPIQTMHLAPEDGAGLKRAHQAALDEYEARVSGEVLVGVGTLAGVKTLAETNDAILAQIVQDEVDADHGPALDEDAKRDVAPLDEVRGPVAEVAGLPSKLGLIQPRVSIPGLNPDLKLDHTPNLTFDQSPVAESTWRVSFERIGRRRDVADLDVTVPAGAKDRVQDYLAEAIWRYAGRFMVSRDFEVSVDPETWRVMIGWGRFGAGRVARVS